jgi:hypothetical protein
MSNNNRLVDTQIIGNNSINNAYSFDVQGNMNVNGSLTIADVLGYIFQGPTGNTGQTGYTGYTVGRPI